MEGHEPGLQIRGVCLLQGAHFYGLVMPPAQPIPHCPPTPQLPVGPLQRSLRTTRLSLPLRDSNSTPYQQAYSYIPYDHVA